MEGGNSGSEALVYGNPADARTHRDEILVRCVVVLVRALWARVRGRSKASKPGRRVVSGSAAVEVGRRNKTRRDGDDAGDDGDDFPVNHCIEAGRVRRRRVWARPSYVWCQFAIEFWSKSGVALDQTTLVMAGQGDYYLSCSSTQRGVVDWGELWGGERRKLVYGVCGGSKCWGSGAGKLGE